jgi:hypothetical protein
MTSPNKSGGKNNNNNKKRKANDNKKLLGPSSGSSAPPPPWSAPPMNPWMGFVQAWPLPICHPSALGLLSPRPVNVSQQALDASSFQPPINNNHQLPTGLMEAL